MPHPYRRKWEIWGKVLLYVCSVIVTSFVSYIGVKFDQFVTEIESLKINQVIQIEHLKNTDEKVKKHDKELQQIREKCC